MEHKEEMQKQQGTGRYDIIPIKNFKLKKYKQITELQKKKEDINWAAILINDMNYFVDLLQKSPVQFDTQEICKYIDFINQKFSIQGNKSNLQNINVIHYQQILRILAHKANDDHTGVHFYSPELLYAGFTASFEVKDDQSFTVEYKKNKFQNFNNKIYQQQYEEAKKYNMQILQLKVDIVNDFHLLDKIKQGDLITHINGKPANKYMQNVAEFCHRKTNSFLYNMQKSAIMLGMYNVFFPIKNITILSNKKQQTIQIEYQQFQWRLRFDNQTITQYLNNQLNKSFKQQPLRQQYITPNIYYLKIQSFTDYIKSDDMQKFKQNTQKKKNLQLIMIDIRDNSGGYTSELELLLRQINVFLSDYFANTNQIWTNDIQLLQKQHSQRGVSVLNDQKTTVSQKQHKLYDLQNYYSWLYEKYKQGYTFTRHIYEDAHKMSNQDLQIVQKFNASAFQKNKIPGIILLTNYNCKSSCSIFAKLVSLLPNVIIIGKEVQSFNLSGSSEVYDSSSQQCLFQIPHVKDEFPKNIEDVFKTVLNPQIYILNSKYLYSDQDMFQLLIENQKKISYIIKQQCDIFLKQHKHID